MFANNLDRVKLQQIPPIIFNLYRFIQLLPAEPLQHGCGTHLQRIIVFGILRHGKRFYSRKVNRREQSCTR
jgi:hypothetical protein